MTFPNRQRSSRESHRQESETDEDGIDPNNVGPDEVKRRLTANSFEKPWEPRHEQGFEIPASITCYC